MPQYVVQRERERESLLLAVDCERSWDVFTLKWCMQSHMSNREGGMEGWVTMHTWPAANRERERGRRRLFVVPLAVRSEVMV